MLLNTQTKFVMVTIIYFIHYNSSTTGLWRNPLKTQEQPQGLYKTQSLLNNPPLAANPAQTPQQKAFPSVPPCTAPLRHCPGICADNPEQGRAQMLGRNTDWPLCPSLLGVRHSILTLWYSTGSLGWKRTSKSSNPTQLQHLKPQDPVPHPVFP